MSIDARDELDWSQTDARAVDLIRVLAMDAVQKAGSGHPGTAMSLAPAAYLLYQHVLRHDPADPAWLGRDRFVLSCGHSSLTLYIQLYLSGYGLTLDDLKPSAPGEPHPRPPGALAHPGRGDHHRPARPGPGQRRRHGHGRPPRAGPARPGRRAGHQPVRPPHLRRSCSDGDIEEGISHEASSLAAAPGARQPDRALRRQPASPSRTTPRSPSPRTWPPATRPTAGTCSAWTGASPTATTRTSQALYQALPGGQGAHR